MAPRLALRERPFEAAAWAVVALGVVLRGARYLVNRSLWGDEGSLAANLTGRSLAQLAEPLDFGQAAPLGFLWLEKLATIVLGEGELVLRLVPLLAGVAALPLFYAVVRDLMDRREALLATAMLALSEPLVFYASECKPYSLDVLVALLVTRSGLDFARKGPSARRAAWLALAGVVGVWISFPAIFVCTGWALGLSVGAWRSGGVRRLLPVAGIAALWGASFAAHYAVSLADLPSRDALAQVWRNHFPPSPAGSLHGAAWWGRTFLSFWNDPAGLPAREVAALLFLLGLFRWLRRDPATAALLLAPVGFALLGAALKVAPFPTSSLYGPADRYYPFFGRLILFTVPLALPFVARGLAVLFDAGGRGVAGWIAAVLLFPVPAYWAVVNLLDPPRIHEARPLMAQVTAHSEAGDRLFAQGYALGVVTYYARRFGLGEPAGELVLRRPRQVSALIGQIAPLRAGQRFWVVTLHHRHWRSEREREAISRVLAQLAEPLETLEGDGAEGTLWRRTAASPRGTRRGAPRASSGAPSVSLRRRSERAASPAPSPRSSAVRLLCRLQPDGTGGRRSRDLLDGTDLPAVGDRGWAASTAIPALTPCRRGVHDGVARGPRAGD